MRRRGLRGAQGCTASRSVRGTVLSAFATSVPVPSTSGTAGHTGRRALVVLPGGRNERLYRMGVGELTPSGVLDGRLQRMCCRLVGAVRLLGSRQRVSVDRSPAETRQARRKARKTTPGWRPILGPNMIANTVSASQGCRCGLIRRIRPSSPSSNTIASPSLRPPTFPSPMMTPVRRCCQPRCANADQSCCRRQH